MQIVSRKINTLKPYEKNARTHSKKQVNLIAESIKNFGFNVPILIDKDGSIMAGHGRLAAANQLGLAEVPCIEIGHLTPAQRRAFILADNRIALDAGWNADLLKGELDFLRGEGMDLGLTGFNQSEIFNFIGALGGLTDEDAVPEAPKNPKSKLGDIWLLGQHRVMCGDSTSKEAVTALLAGAKPNLMVTDPPYGVDYDADWRNHALKSDGTGSVDRAIGKVKNDNRSDWTEAWKLFPGSIAYVWHADLHANTVADSLIACGFGLRALIVWSKSNFAIGRGDYHHQHEPCWYAVKGKGNWTGDRKQTTVWDIDKPQKSETGHSTQKPVECMRRPMMNNSVKGDKVYDPFLGSGTTVIAAETEGRVCYGMELSPEYVDMAVKRWQGFTGQQATLEATGEAFGG